ncbi:sentrin-specific protease 5 [Trichomycterus rosablanca]|uniref:sentrin-specific protease 5 n=1 Tax=Trichomycterus rosablanca TaxID=2290929 RepID=UPI002F3596C3
MRVQVNKNTNQAKPAPADMSEYGRSRRKRVPKLCDCCGPNGKPHLPGHDPVTKRRGRKKKEVEKEVEVTTEKTSHSVIVEQASTADTDNMTVCDVQQVTLSEETPILSEEQIISTASDLPFLLNGTVLGPEKINNEISDTDSISLTDSKQSGSVTQTSSDTHCDLTSLDLHSNCMEKLAEPSAHNSDVVSDHPADAEAMEVEHTVSSAYLNIKALRDHRYCKWPHSASEEQQADAAQPPLTEIQQDDIVEHLHEYLELFYGKYGSFIPLSEEDILEYLNKHLNLDFNDKRKMISKEVMKYQASLACASMHFFKVTYNKHTLALEDLSTLGDQNWVNDQVINMYGELIMDATNHKVHFFNSFFYRQLVAKGFEGVKRWTKKVDVFSKRLLLIPLHLEIHWSLITVDVSKQNINFYDSQGILFKFAVDNILKYMIAEAKEKKQAAFQKGWKMTVNKGIPQQKNDNDCGVFVLEYCKCLAFKEPLRFTQEDMPKVRKRIYKELCDCKLTDFQNKVEA